MAYGLDASGNLLDANGNVVLDAAGNPISQVTDSEGNIYYVDNQTGARQDNVVQDNSPVTPAAYTAAYQQVFNTPPSPDQVNQAVQAYSGSTMQNAISDLGLVAQQNPQSVAQSGSPPPVIDPTTGQQVVFAPVGNYTPEGQPVTQQQNIVSEGVGMAQGGAAAQFAFNTFPATGKPEQYSDYQGVPTVNVDANGNVTAWRTADNQIMTPATFNAAVANGQDKQSLEPASLKPPANNPGFLQSVLNGALFIASVALAAPEFASLTSALNAGMGVAEAGLANSGLAGAVTNLASSIGTGISDALGLNLSSDAAKMIGQSVIGGTKSGTQAAVNGNNVGEAIVAGGGSPLVSGTLTSVLSNSGFDPSIAKTLGNAVGKATGGYFNALSSGQSQSQALSSAELGAGESVVQSGLQGAVDLLAAPDQNATPEEQQASKDLASGLKSVESLAQQFVLDPALAQALGIDTSTTQQAAAATNAPGQTKAPTTATNYSAGGTSLKSGTGGTGSSVTFYGSGSSPGDTVVQIGSPSSQALGSALGIGSPSSAIGNTTDSSAGETPDPSTGGTPQNVWNQASLRVKDDTGSY